MKYYIVRENGTAHEATSTSTGRDAVIAEITNSKIRDTEKGPMVLLFLDTAYLISGEVKSDDAVNKVESIIKDWLNSQDATVFAVDAAHTSGSDYTFDPASKEMKIHPLAGINQARKDELVEGAKTWAESLKQQPARQQPAQQQPAQQQPVYSQRQANSINALREECENMGYKPVSWKTGERVQATTTP